MKNKNKEEWMQISPLLLRFAEQSEPHPCWQEDHQLEKSHSESYPKFSKLINKTRSKPETKIRIWTTEQYKNLPRESSWEGSASWSLESGFMPSSYWWFDQSLELLRWRWWEFRGLLLWAWAARTRENSQNTQRKMSSFSLRVRIR